jgi:hypothetical protein
MKKLKKHVREEEKEEDGARMNNFDRIRILKNSLLFN